MRFYFDLGLGAGWQEVSSLVRDNFTLTDRACSSEFKPSVNNLSISLNYDAILFAALRNTFDYVNVRAYEDDGITLTFSGRFKPAFGSEYNGIVGIQQLSISVDDLSSILDVNMSEFVTEDMYILNPADTSHSIVHNLFTHLGLSHSLIDSSVSVLDIVGAACADDDTSALDFLSTLLWEYGWVVNWNEEGEFHPIKWIQDSGATPVFTFDDTNVIGSIKESANPVDKEGYKVIWYGLGERAATRVYTESLEYDEDGDFEGYPILSETYYPDEANVIDETTGLPQVVEQEYSETGIRYQPNKYIDAGYAQDFALEHADFTRVLVTKNHVISDEYDAGLTRDVTVFGNKKARIRYYNPNLTSRQLYYMHIDADVTYTKSKNTSLVEYVTGTKKIDSYDSSFLFSAITADRLAMAMASAHRYGRYTYSFDSEEKVAEGSYVLIQMGNGVTATGLLLERAYDNVTQLYSYTVRGYSSTYAEVAARTTHLSSLPQNDATTIALAANKGPVYNVDGNKMFWYSVGSATPVNTSLVLTANCVDPSYVPESYQWYYRTSGGVDTILPGETGQTLTVAYNAAWFYTGVTVFVRINGKYTFTAILNNSSSSAYLGNSNTDPAHPTVGDWYFYTGATGGGKTQNTMYTWNGTAWVEDTYSGHITADYSIVMSASSLKRDIDGAYSPTTITASVTRRLGLSPYTTYAGRFIVAESTNGTSYTDVYTSSSDESSYTHTPGANVLVFRFRFYRAGGTSTLLKEVFVPVAVDGLNGEMTVLSDLTTPGARDGEIAIYKGNIYEWDSDTSTWTLRTATIPTGEILYYDGESLVEKPDNVAATTYSAEWSSGVDGWTGSGATLAVSGRKLLATATGATVAIVRASLTSATLRDIRIKYKSPRTGTVSLLGTVAGSPNTLIRTFSYPVANVEMLLDAYVAGALTAIYTSQGSMTVGDVITLSSAYVGTGLADSPLIDNSGNNANATVTAVCPQPGKAGYGMEFNGFSSRCTYAAVPKAIVSMCAWVKFTSTAADMRVIQENGGGGAYARNLVSIASKRANLQWRRDASNNDTLVGTVDINDGNWHFIVGVWDTANVYLYVDGILNNSKASTLYNVTPDVIGSIGSNPSASVFFAGYLDEIRIFSRALTASEVLGLYLAPQGNGAVYNWGDYLLDSGASNGVITPQEKITYYQKWYEISGGVTSGGTTGSYWQVYNQALSYSVSTTALYNAFTALYNALYGSSPTITPTPILSLTYWDTPIPLVSSSLFQGLWSTYRSEEAALAKLIANPATYPSDTGLLLAYNFETHPECPDNAAGRHYIQDAWATTDGWTASGGTAVVSGIILTATSSSIDLQIYKTGMSFSGNSFRKVRIKIRQTAGTANPTLQLYYSTGSHSWSSSYYKDVLGRIPALNTWYVIDIDMTTLTAGGTDWTSNTITGLRLDLGAASGQVFEIDWIYVGNGNYDTKLADNSGNGYEMTVYGITPVPGAVSKAFSFDGVTSRCVGTTAHFPHTGAFTVFAWVEGKARSAIQGILARDSGSAGTRGFRCSLDANNRPTIFISADGTATVSLTADAGTECTSDCSLAFVFNPSTGIYIYKNGILVKSLTTGVPASVFYSASQSLIIGQGATSLYSFSGWIDDFRLYTRVLSASDILGLTLNKPAMPVSDAKAMAPKYLGALTSPPSTHMGGDWFFYIGSTAGAWTQYTMYYWGGITWAVDTNSGHLAQAWTDLLDLAEASPQAVTIINNLVAANAFIDALATSTQRSNAMCDDDVTPIAQFDWNNAILTLYNAAKTKMMELTDASLKSYGGQGVQRRGVQVTEDGFDFIDAPEGGDETAIARMRRLGVGSESILMDGDFIANLISEWGDEYTINGASSRTPGMIQTADGTIRLAYRRESDYFIVERIYDLDTRTWGSEIVIDSTVSGSTVYSGFPCYTQDLNGTLHIAYVRRGDYFLVERIYNSGSSTWGSASVIKNTAVAYPSYLQTSDGTLRILYSIGSYQYERIYNINTSTWGTETEVGAISLYWGSFIEDIDGTLRCMYLSNPGVGYDQLTEAVFNVNTYEWEYVRTVTDSNCRWPQFIQYADKSLHILYFDMGWSSADSIVEKIWNSRTSTWGDASLICENDTGSDFAAIQLDDGDIMIAYTRTNLYGRILRRYAQLGAGVIETGGSIYDSGGCYRKFSDGVLEQWGTYEITMASGAATEYTFSPAIDFKVPPGVLPFMENPVTTALIQPVVHWNFILRGTQTDYNTISIIIENSGASQTAYIKWHAIGRWK